MPDLLANRYEIEALIGRGATGEVFRARDLTLGETVAVKVLRLDTRDVVSALRRFKQEVRLARRVTHKNVARVFDLVEDGDRVLLTMELVLGETLADVLAREKSLSLDRAVRIGLEMCAGLEAVHAAGVVHRDLKPGNVILEHPREDALGEPRVVLADFGVARNALDATSLALGAVVGTPKYMSPEQAQGLVVDARADIYSLGVVLQEIAGEGEVDARYADIVRRCLEPDRDARPASVTEVAAALEAIARSGCSVVVLPFRSPSDATLGDVIAQELTDVLCTIRELRVVATPATATLGDRDPQRIHRSLSVDAMIDGTVQVEGERVRITARLIETPSGKQQWHEHFEGSLSELFSFENTIAKRVAEHLRLRVTVMAFDEGVPPDAVRMYLDACALGEGPLTTEKAVALLDRAVTVHPRFAPALSALALRSLTAWYVPFVHTGPEWSETCAARVARALRDAGSLAETHVAAAVLHLERGSPREAEQALKRALELAPTCVEALNVLGEVECHTGRREAGISHARLASELAPNAVIPAVTLARDEAYDGKLDACVARLDALGDDAWSPPPFLLRVRAASWHGASDVIRGWLTRGAGMSDASGRFPYGELVAQGLLGEAARDEVDMMVDGLLAAGKSPRFRAETLRVATEIHVASGRRDDALRRLRALAELPAFFDVEWLERCPALRTLSTEPAYVELLEVTRRRAHTAV
jgi:TolB-like protein/tRNA A-37 threonylcarbamoyl transferase component Bud32/tetratricopeptide (TPR) repeat protein